MNVEIEDGRSQGERSSSECAPAGFEETNHHIVEGPSDRELGVTSNC